MATPITVGERIVLHLSQYSKHQNDFDAPFEVSQDGIGEALRISRAHAAIELKKLREAGAVTERIAHIRAGPVKRKVYFLTESGEGKARSLKDFADRQGIEISPLLDLKKCKGEELWAQLNDESKALMAKAAVFRKPFKRSALPTSTVTVLPEDRQGMTEVPPNLRASIPQLLDKDRLKEAHSFAADYWLTEGDYSERLHHLICANRSLEANMLLATRGRQLVRSSPVDLLESLKEVKVAMSKYVTEIRDLKGEAALRAGDLAYGLSISEEMVATGDDEEIMDGLTLKGRIFLAQGKAKEALENLEHVRKVRSDPLLECDLAMGLGLLGRNDEAVNIIESVGRKFPITDPDILEETYARKGDVLFYLGRQEGAIANYSKALGLARPGDKSGMLKAMAECYEAMGMRDKAREYRKKAVKR